MRLCVGLLGEGLHGWRTLLRQIGVPFEIAENISADRYSVVVSAQNLTRLHVEQLRAYLNDGGALLCPGKIYEQLTGKNCAERFIRYLVEGKGGEVFSGIGLADVYAKCFIPHGANALVSSDGQPSAVVGQLGNGVIIALPFDPDELMRDQRAIPKSFYAARNRLPYEHVSMISRSGIRKIVARSLEILHHTRGLPFLHTWLYPSSEKNVFSFRVDTDYADRNDIESLYALIKKYNIPATWFVDVKSQQDFLSLYKTMASEGQEIGIHCYEHDTFEDYRQNNENIAMAKSVLEPAGIQAKSFAAPYGKWNEGLARAIDAHGFEYSSEFSFDYDNVPSYPIVNDSQSHCLQVPVHPVSIGSLRRQGFSSDEMIAYFQNVIRYKLSCYEPLFLYHHPKNYHHDVLEKLFSSMQQENIKAGTMIDYAQWWKLRCSQQLRAAVEGTTLHLGGSTSDDVHVKITMNNGDEAIIAPQAAVDLRSVPWNKSKHAMPLPQDIHRIKKFNPWMAINRIEDYLSATFLKK